MRDASGKMLLLAFLVWTLFSKAAILLEASPTFWPPKDNNDGRLVQNAAFRSFGGIPLLKNGHFAPSVLHFWPFKGPVEG